MKNTVQANSKWASPRCGLFLLCSHTVDSWGWTPWKFNWYHSWWELCWCKSRVLIPQSYLRQHWLVYMFTCDLSSLTTSFPNSDLSYNFMFLLWKQTMRSKPLMLLPSDTYMLQLHFLLILARLNDFDFRDSLDCKDIKLSWLELFRSRCKISPSKMKA